ncbi:enhancer of rudimentary-domain-containing protein [Piptocephalis cylindrospora]|uniref:Enhancer of rudimentary-domain-containing protein n=1 Tax=Piptocephalis cylindrospora TaxID=1907219 RepID=A0A4P9Y4R1_9FUNG|nr:enhancer of rudimentary-domain-containing protein [Piptocephalis cylindrospora]|eukprot:RKP13968.1 enhancer of rudimentary-domain-containing protein [Piptocephalis cylindrospora]
MEDSAINKAHSFVALAEELEEKSAWIRAAEAHSLAAAQFQAATRDTQVEDIQRTLCMMRDDHTRRARQLRQSHPSSPTTSRAIPPFVPTSPMILAPRPHRRPLESQGKGAFPGLPSAFRGSGKLGLPIPARPTSNPSPRPPPWRRPTTGIHPPSSKRSPLGHARILEEDGLFRSSSALLDTGEERSTLSIPMDRPVLSEGDEYVFEHPGLSDNDDERMHPAEEEEGEREVEEDTILSSPRPCRSPSPSESFFLVKEDYTDLGYPSKTSSPGLHEGGGGGYGDRLIQRTTHTLLLVQVATGPESRSWSEHDSVTHAIQEIIEAFQTQLKRQNPRARNISYDLDDLFGFIDSHQELCALVYEPTQKAYAPKDRAWLKERASHYLMKQARTSAGGAR